MKALEFLQMKFPMWSVQDRLPFNTVSLREENLIEAMEEFAKTEFQIAWELSLSKDKPFFVDTIRKLINSYLKEEISLSKFVEELNVSAYKWNQFLNSNEPGAVSSHESEKEV